MGREALWGAKLPLVGGLRVLNGGGGGSCPDSCPGGPRWLKASCRSSL